MPDSFTALLAIIDSPPEPLDAAPGTARRLLIQATIGATATEELAREIEAFESDYEMLIGTIATGGPKGGVDVWPLQGMLRARLQRIALLCKNDGTVH